MSASPNWTAREAQILLGLDEALDLALLCEALGLPLSPSADVDLLKELRKIEPLSEALSLFELGLVELLVEELLRRYPSDLPAPVVHHLALGWREAGGHRLLRACRGHLYLWDKEKEYLHQRAGGEGPVEAWPTRFLAEHYEDVASLGGGAEGKRARESWSFLMALEKFAKRDGLSEQARSQLSGARRLAKGRAVVSALQKVERRVQEAEKHRLRGDDKGFEGIFLPALEVAALLGHDESLSVGVLELVVPFAWPIHEAREGAKVARIMKPILPFIDDLEQRLLKGEAFGRQGLYCDALVHLVQEPSPSKGEERRLFLEARERRLRSALAINEIHRNTRVMFANTLDNLCRHYLVHQREKEEVPRVRAMINEIRQTRPDYSGLNDLEAFVNRWS